MGNVSSLARRVYNYLNGRISCGSSWRSRIVSLDCRAIKCNCMIPVYG